MCEKQSNITIGLVDADLLDGGTRHPNLALLKISGFLFDNNVPFELIEDSNADVSKYHFVYISKVFSFTKDPVFLTKARQNGNVEKFKTGGTGYYATITKVREFKTVRIEDMERLEKDDFLCNFPNMRGGNKTMGIDMARQMPYYHLYDKYIEKKIANGTKRSYFKDYLEYSIGFLTRGCFRHCPFCVNKLEDTIKPYSKLEWFHDKSRKNVYFWDDNFLSSPYDVWKPILEHLIDNKITFQFRQGLDERQLAENEHGEEMAEMLSKARYHGDYIFAFDNWRDRDIIEKSLKIWKKYNPHKGTKFYLFCGFKQSCRNKDKFYQDIYEIFQRIKLLMQYGCVGYIMRHEDYHKAPVSNLYIQIARWCNQQQFYKKMSFWEFCYRNQSYWEEHTLNVTDRPNLKTFEEFEQDMKDGYYEKVKMCLPLKTVIQVLELFPERRADLIEMFNYTMKDLVNDSLWNKP